ncbi:MAG: small subunit ribosomal protein [Candidatus Eremiobacteraeota bacterium]|nr:small subunit ribosomal protein [Candidatus Eremiobacteraeota bacterium]
MGQKIHPVGLRLGITRTWDSRWFEDKNYVAWLHEDVKIRKYFGRMTRAAAISRVEIERRANQARIIINTGKPGIIIGKRGVGIDEIRRNLETLTGKQVQVNVVEIKVPELDARLVGQNIVDQLEKRIAFRRAMKQAIMRTMKAGARGVKVQVSGRLGGAEIARTERNHDGKVPLHTLRADIDYAHVEAFTTFGRIGVKVWIYKGEVLPDQPRGEREGQGRPGAGGDPARFRDNRRGTRGGRGRSGEGAGGGRGPRPGAGGPTGAPGLDTSEAMRVAQADAQSVESVTDGAPSEAGNKPNAPHAGEQTGYRQHDEAARADRGVVGETSQPNPDSQGTVDAAERPGAHSSAPTADHTEPAPGGGTHNRPELKTGPEDDNAGAGEVGR